jgi:ubiquinone/menaquinone biosynthesis C-methylase UbiE
MNFGTLSSKYHGQVAESYEERRQDAKWHAENDAAEELLALLPNVGKSLDVPVGTGRLIPYFAPLGYTAHGVDISPDMLREARARAEQIGAEIELEVGDVRNLKFPDQHFDLVCCLRFLNWIDAKSVEHVIEELTRDRAKRARYSCQNITICRCSRDSRSAIGTAYPPERLSEPALRSSWFDDCICSLGRAAVG